MSRTAGPDVSWYEHRRARLLIVGLLGIVLVVGAAVLYRSWSGRSDLTDSATVTASSIQPGTDPRNLAGGRPGSTGGVGWAAAEVRTGAWVRFDWATDQEIGTLQVTRPALTSPGVTAGFLEFSDGSRLAMPLSAGSAVTRLSFQPRSVRWVRFTVSGLAAGTTRLALTSISIARLGPRAERVDGSGAEVNVALSARVSSGAGAGDGQALADGDDSGGTGAAWTPSTPTGAWVQYSWSSPQEIAAVEILGAGGSDGRYVSAAHLTLTDTSGVIETIPLGGISPQPGRPSIVGFLPRVVTGIRLSVDAVGGSATGAVSLAEWQVYRRGATPAPPTDLTETTAAGTSSSTPGGGSATRSSSTPGTDDPETTCTDADQVRAEQPVTVLCPLLGAAVGDRVSLRLLLGSGYDSVRATPWPATAGQADGPSVQATAADGGVRDSRAELDLDLSSMAPGPLTVAIQADGSGRDPGVVRLTLDHHSAQNAPNSTGTTAPASLPAAVSGQTLVYDEEFDRTIPLATGTDAATGSAAAAVYTAGKPNTTGTESFGEAGFANPTLDPDVYRSVDSASLRLLARPDGGTASGVYAGDGGSGTGSGRAGSAGSVSALVSSARPGGAGFAAQYGIFEARMLTSAAPGTWPAFWMLPTDNLVSNQPTVAEVDAVELYGHDPTTGCQATHSYHSGADSGRVQCGTRFASARQAAQWHTYRVSVSPTGIVFSIDDTVVATADQVPGGGVPLFFMIDLALGGGWPVELGPVRGRGALFVDWVRVWV